MEEYIYRMNQSMKELIKKTLKVARGNFPLKLFIFKTLFNQRRAIMKRNKLELNGTHIPPFMIASITSKCNLHCKGCYAHENNNKIKSELSIEKWHDIFKEAKELGISFILLAGGEPFMREDIIYAAGKYPQIIFPVFTNSTLLNEERIKKLIKMRNIIPVISIEGDNSLTDERRGPGIGKKTEEIMLLLQKHHIFYGLSLTITKKNFNIITCDNFVSEYIEKGCRIFFYVEYVPALPGTENLVLSAEDRLLLDKKLTQLRMNNPALFIAFPGDEKEYGGCLSSGRGFVHISSSGNLEPCPFAPFSDTSLVNQSLISALNSPLLKTIRESGESLNELENGCALFNKKEWLLSLLHKQEQTIK